MKKGLLTFFIVLVLVWSCGTVFAQGKGKGAGGQGKRTEKLQRKHKSRQVEANEPGGQGKEKRVRRQEHRRELQEMRRKERQKIRVTRGKGKGHQQQLKSLKTQMVHEEAKHRRRIARLKRILELAAEENDTKTVERVAKLLEMELLRHNRKRQHMQEREQKTLQLAEKSLSEEAQRVIKKDTNKKKTKAKEQKQGQE